MTQTNGDNNVTDIAVCIPVFTRVDKLSNLLDSIEKEGIKKVYIADDGKLTEKKEELYSQTFEFDLTVFDLEYDAGVGKKRQILAMRPKENYLLFVDSDMEVPQNYAVLKKQLEERPNTGFIAGMYMETDRIYTVASDLYLENDVLYRDIREKKEIEWVAGFPLVEFDFLPQVGMLRKECAEDYNWDGEYTIMREHIDFFVGHWKHTDWKMAQCPNVFFPHYPGGNQKYMSERHSDRKYKNSDDHFCDKWGIKKFEKKNALWIDTYQPTSQKSKLDSLFDKYNNDGLTGVIMSISSYLISLFQN